MEKIIIKINGMHCTSCEKVIHDSVKKIKGVMEVKADYAKGNAEIIFNPQKTNEKEIKSAIEKAGYTCFTSPKKNSILGVIFGVIGILLIGYFIFYLSGRIPILSIDTKLGYGLLFIAGLLTGFHCIAMCGGFVISYTAKDALAGRKSYASHLKYGIGKTISYTIIGALFGLVGSLIAFTPMIRGIAGIIAGLFLVIFGLNMLNIFPWFKRFRIRQPKAFSKLFGKNNGPLIIGLLNGLMIACGPLQAIYIMAAGTSSMIEGAKLLFIFAIGTLPVMLGFGFFASIISKQFTQKILKASGVIVIALGLIMLNRGLILTGNGFVPSVILNTDSGTIKTTTNELPGINMNNGYQEIRMDVTNNGWEPNSFVLKTGVPVKWIITGKEITGCNNEIIVPEYNLDFKIQPGEQAIEFTPTKAGVVRWSCWMGMIQGQFLVKDDTTSSSSPTEEFPLPAAPKAGGCGCGMGR